MTTNTIVNKGAAVTYRGQLVGFYDEIKDELELNEPLSNIEVVLEDAYDHWIIVPTKDLDLAVGSKYVDLDAHTATSEIEKLAEQCKTSLEFDRLTEAVSIQNKTKSAIARPHFINESESLVLASLAFTGDYYV